MSSNIVFLNDLFIPKLKKLPCILPQKLKEPYPQLLPVPPETFTITDVHIVDIPPSGLENARPLLLIVLLPIKPDYHDMSPPRRFADPHHHDAEVCLSVRFLGREFFYQPLPCSFHTVIVSKRNRCPKDVPQVVIPEHGRKIIVEDIIQFPYVQWIILYHLKAMLRDGMDILFYNCKEEDTVIWVGTESQMVVAELLADTCVKELAGYRVSVRNTDNVEVAGVIFGNDKKE
jgi:hypothetical protein